MAKKSKSATTETVLFLPWRGEGSLHQRLPGCKGNSGEDQEQVSSATSDTSCSTSGSKSHIPSNLLPFICRRFKPAAPSSTSAQRASLRLLSQLPTSLAPSPANRGPQPSTKLCSSTTSTYHVHRNPATPPAVTTSSPKPATATPSPTTTKNRTPP